MRSHWTRRTVAGALLLTGFGAAALAAGAGPAVSPLAGPLVPTVTQAASTCASRRPGVPAGAVPERRARPLLLPRGASRTGDRLGRASPGPGRCGDLPPLPPGAGTGPDHPPPRGPPGPIPRRERFLNTLIGGENRLIGAQANAVLAAARLVTQLTQVSRLLGILPPGQAAPFLKLYGVLNSRLHNLNLFLAVNDRALLDRVEQRGVRLQPLEAGGPGVAGRGVLPALDPASRAADQLPRTGDGDAVRRAADRPVTVLRPAGEAGGGRLALDDGTVFKAN